MVVERRTKYLCWPLKLMFGAKNLSVKMVAKKVEEVNENEPPI
jgi:hypothetical protein